MIGTVWRSEVLKISHDLVLRGHEGACRPQVLSRGVPVSGMSASALPPTESGLALGKRGTWILVPL